MVDDWESKGEKNEPACINWLNSKHSVWKSEKKSHSTLRAKRAIFTFSGDKTSLKVPKMVNFGKCDFFGDFQTLWVRWVGGWDMPKPICWLLSPHQLARWVDGIYAEMQCYQKLQQKCSVLEHQSFCLTSCIFILSEKEHLMFLQSTGQALFPLSAKPLWSRLESRYDHKVYHHAQWVKIP